MYTSSFENKKIIIFGLGSYKYGSGISAAKFFIKQGAKVLITDKKNEKDLREAVRQVKNFGKSCKNSPVFTLGQHRPSDFRNAHIVVRNPGVPADHPLLRLARKHGAQIHTDVSLFLSRIKNYESPHQSKLNAGRVRIKVIGVTGTRGKSTTSALIAEILKKAGKKVFLGGNLGYSPLNFIDQDLCPLPVSSPDGHRGRRGGGITHIVLELSSWLVESLDEWKISPDCAVITNIYPDHLNTYKNMSDYIKAKSVIFKYQKPTDVLVLNRDNKITRSLAKKAGSRVHFFFKNFRVFSRQIAGGVLRNSALGGEHNLENIAAALALSKTLGINQKLARQAVSGFKGLWGRLQFVREWRGIKFYNDTTATSPEATAQALRTLAKLPNSKPEIRNPKSGIILIAGGMDKNLDYKKLAREIPQYIKALILFKGSASDKILHELKIMNYKLREKTLINLKNHNSLFVIHNSIGSMHEAIKLAIKNTQRGDIVLLSPAAASFNIFRNEIDRGEQFVKIVEKL